MLRTLSCTQAVHSGADLSSAVAAVTGYQQKSMKGKTIEVEAVPGVMTPRLSELLEAAQQLQQAPVRTNDLECGGAVKARPCSHYALVTADLEGGSHYNLPCRRAAVQACSQRWWRRGLRWWWRRGGSCSRRCRAATAPAAAVCGEPTTQTVTFLGGAVVGRARDFARHDEHCSSDMCAMSASCFLQVHVSGLFQVRHL